MALKLAAIAKMYTEKGGGFAVSGLAEIYCANCNEGFWWEIARNMCPKFCPCCGAPLTIRLTGD
jgi:hypothetical protein